MYRFNLDKFKQSELGVELQTTARAIAYYINRDDKTASQLFPVLNAYILAVKSVWGITLQFNYFKGDDWWNIVVKGDNYTVFNEKVL